MKTEATHVRAGTGHFITVKVTPEGTETIAEVDTSLDQVITAADVRKSWQEIGRAHA
jgi:hypothetical protein